MRKRGLDGRRRKVRRGERAWVFGRRGDDGLYGRMLDGRLLEWKVGGRWVWVLGPREKELRQGWRVEVEVEQ